MMTMSESAANDTSNRPNKSKNGRRVYVIGVGMARFEKPGRRKDEDYTDDALQACTKALMDAGITFDDVQWAAAGYVYGDSTCGQRAIYQLGLTQIPIVNVNNNCSTGSTALYLARQSILSGNVDCALALGFEKMDPGSLVSMYKDRTNPMDVTISILNEAKGIDPKSPLTPQIFAQAGLEYIEKNGGSNDAVDWIAYKSHAHSTLNPYAQFRQQYTLDQVKSARKVFGPLTLLHCSPTSDGAAACVLASEEFVHRHGLGNQAVEICAQTLATDSVKAFDPTGQVKSAMEIAGVDMSRRAAQDAYAMAGIKPDDVDVAEVHDCFSSNELVTIDAVGLCPPGRASEFVLSGATTLPQFDTAPKDGKHGQQTYRRVVVNPSGGLISKGHPLGATGLAQCCELTWQLRDWAGDRQVKTEHGGPKYALQHNIGLGGAAVVTIYGRPSDRVVASGASRQDPRKRVGYNPAIQCVPVTPEDVCRVMSSNGSLIGTRDQIQMDIHAKLVARAYRAKETLHLEPKHKNKL